MRTESARLLSEASHEALRLAALDTRPVSGLTHRFYRYPARFSPRFATAAIEQFSKPGDLVLDAYMGGATSVVQALASGRRAVGCDINSLAVFIARVKTTPLSSRDRDGLKQWATRVVPSLLYSDMPPRLRSVMSVERTRNLTLPTARPIKKVMTLALLTLHTLPSVDAQRFARCALLNAGQWALNGRRQAPSLPQFRDRLARCVTEMLDGLTEFERQLAGREHLLPPVLINDTATNIPRHAPFDTEKADLAVSSPPYPGIHALYHRWQVDGRRETPAPYWLADCHDGAGLAFYTFADRQGDPEKYFAESLRTLRGIRGVMREGAAFVQMLAFSDPDSQLPRYLANMEAAGFVELLPPKCSRVWRVVPRRKWHAQSKGNLNGSREVVLVHRAV